MLFGQFLMSLGGFVSLEDISEALPPYQEEVLGVPMDLELSEAYAKLLASQIRQRFSSDWGLSETGATGPTGNRYGDAAGHSCMAVAGLKQSAITLETGSADRIANMHVFAATALDLMLQKLSR